MKSTLRNLTHIFQRRPVEQGKQSANRSSIRLFEGSKTPFLSFPGPMLFPPLRTLLPPLLLTHMSPMIVGADVIRNLARPATHINRRRPRYRLWRGNRCSEIMKNIALSKTFTFLKIESVVACSVWTELGSQVAALISTPFRALFILVTPTIAIGGRRPIINAEGGIRRTTTATSAEIRGSGSGSKRNPVGNRRSRSSRTNRGVCGPTPAARPNRGRRGGRTTAVAAGERGTRARACALHGAGKLKTAIIL